MKPALAFDLWRKLCAAYPTTKPRHDETRDVWLDRLGKLDADVGAKAIDSLIDAVKFFPTIAELHEHAEVVREQAARRRREQERREADEELEHLERPALRDIPAVREYLGHTHVVPALPTEGRGECDDCARERPTLYRLGKVRLCAECAVRRLRVRERSAAR